MDQSELPTNKAFDRWCFTAMDERVMMDGRPLPVPTVVLHRVCDGDEKKFLEALRALQLSFEAGQRLEG